MKKGKLFQFFATVLALAFVGCSHDTLTGDDSEGDQNGSKDAVYMNVTVQLPVAGGMGSRSKTDTGENDDYGTSTSGTEVGKDYENAVKSVLLVLAQNGGTDDNKIIAYAVSSGADLSEKSSVITSVHKLSKTKLANYYGTDNTLTAEETQIKVYVFCNPTEALEGVIEEATDGTWINEIAEIVETANSSGSSVTKGVDIWGGINHQNGFLMSTARSKDINKVLPSNLSDWDNHTDAIKAFDLTGNNTGYSGGSVDNSTNGSIRVERSVARFDFKDGSLSTTGANTYNVVDGTVGEGESAETKTFIQIQLTKMALVNMSRKFYYLRRVSNDGLDKNAGNTNGFALCGTEIATNYVVDTDAADKQAANLNSFIYGDHFNFCLGSGNGASWTIDANTRNQWYTTEITKVTSTDNEEDNDDTWNSEGNHVTTKDGYRIWRYVTENTIPVPNSGGVAQRHGISTGVVFKGKMIATSDAPQAMKEAINNATGNSSTDAILYAYGNNLFVRWKEVRDYAIENKSTNLAFYNIVFGAANTVDVKKGTGDDYTGAIYSDDTQSPDYLWDKWFNNSKNDTDLKNFKKAATDAQFTLYQSAPDEDDKVENKGCYYCYYYYWNRHNDNGKPSEMGPMEFAVVRNNVYKLAVTNISKLGHPRISENDPDPVDPEDPDESGDVYLKLSVEVLPWVVRVNNIEF